MKDDTTMADKLAISISGIGCLAVLLILAVTTGLLIGTVVAVAKWVAA